MLSAIGLWLICWLVVLPIMNWTVQRTPEGEAVSDAHITIVATGVLAAGLIADVIGFPSVFGAFVFGLLMPQGALTTELRNKLEDFVVGLLLPIYFGASGFKSNVSVITMDDKEGAAFVAALTSIMVLCFVAKLGSNLLIAQYYSLPASRGLSLGLLMNAKGSVEMIILNIGKQKGILDERTYTMMVLGSILTTAVVGPVLEIFNKTSRSRAAYKRRNLQQCRPDSELRMVACVYTARNVPSIISLLQMSNPTKRSPVFVYVVHLLELTGRGAAMMIVQQASSKHSLEKVGSKSSGGALQADQIIAPFQSYEQQAGGVSVQRVTAVSPYSTMDEDIFNIAEERHTTIIVLLPQTAIGGRGLRGGRPGHPQRQHERPGPLALHRVHPRRPRDQRGREVLRGPARAAPRGGPLLRRARRPRGADVLVADGGASRCHPHRYPVPAGRGGHGASEPRSLMRVRREGGHDRGGGGQHGAAAGRGVHEPVPAQARDQRLGHVHRAGHQQHRGDGGGGPRDERSPQHVRGGERERDGVFAAARRVDAVDRVPRTGADRGHARVGRLRDAGVGAGGAAVRERGGRGRNGFDGGAGERETRSGAAVFEQRQPQGGAGTPQRRVDARRLISGGGANFGRQTSSSYSGLACIDSPFLSLDFLSPSFLFMNALLRRGNSWIA
ncbi:Sodium/hydrogen exchanger family [Musa troglodytarum]|nr:Sodium/hydrogen exchanger family [Musa troglodytarum]